MELDFPGSSDGKESAYKAGDLGSIPGSLNQEDSLERGMAIHSLILAWRIPWTEEPGALQSMVLQRVRHDWATNTFPFFRSFQSLKFPEKGIASLFPPWEYSGYSQKPSWPSESSWSRKEANRHKGLLCQFKRQGWQNSLRWGKEKDRLFQMGNLAIMLLGKFFYKQLGTFLFLK